jgi:hypothetical protein
LIASDTGDLIEALSVGVVATHISRYKPTEYFLVHIHDADADARDREQAVEYAKYCLGEGYGWLTICNIALALLTGCKFTFGIDGQVICSACGALPRANLNNFCRVSEQCFSGRSCEAVWCIVAASAWRARRSSVRPGARALILMCHAEFPAASFRVCRTGTLPPHTNEAGRMGRLAVPIGSPGDARKTKATPRPVRRNSRWLSFD